MSKHFGFRDIQVPCQLASFLSEPGDKDCCDFLKITSTNLPRIASFCVRQHFAKSALGQLLYSPCVDLLSSCQSDRVDRISNLIQATPKGFEPLRAEPNGFLVHLLSHSDTVSWSGTWMTPHAIFLGQNKFSTRPALQTQKCTRALE